MANSPRAQTPPTEWEFGGLKRVNGAFRDEDLANVLLDATDISASAFKARGIPLVMRVIEMAAIEQNRAWGTCSLNEFRKVSHIHTPMHD